MAGQAEGKGNTKLILIILVVIIIILIGVIGAFAAMYTNNSKKTDSEQTKRNVVVTDENVEEVADDFFDREYVPPGYYSATMNNEWHFVSGDAESDNAYVANDASNSNDVYFDLFLSDNEDDPIYQSPVIPLGGELKGFKLDKKLNAGTYDCIVIYHLVDENQNSVDTVRVAITVTIDN